MIEKFAKWYLQRLSNKYRYIYHFLPEITPNKCFACTNNGKPVMVCEDDIGGNHFWITTCDKCKELLRTMDFKELSKLSSIAEMKKCGMLV